MCVGTTAARAGCGGVPGGQTREGTSSWGYHQLREGGCVVCFHGWCGVLSWVVWCAFMGGVVLWVVGFEAECSDVWWYEGGRFVVWLFVFEVWFGCS